MTKKRIREMYRQWRDNHKNAKPNRVVVSMRWEDGEGTLTDTIAIVPNRIIGNIDENWEDDALILYYVSSLEGLCELTKPNNGSDFVVEDVLYFYKY